MNTKQIKFLEEDLFYELRLLLGASRMLDFCKELNIQNPTNYFKDSSYLHIRNLYNFFSNTATNDASVKDYDSVSFNLSLYLNWKSPLHNHVLHLKEKRTAPNNTVNGVHLNSMIPAFVQDIESIWNEWINKTTNADLKKILINNLYLAKQQAESDYSELNEKLIKNA